MNLKNFTLKKFDSSELEPKKIDVYFNDKKLGFVYCDGSFYSETGAELFPAHLKTILNIAENFQLFWYNLA